VKRVLRWLYPGLGVKRWLLLILIGVALAAVGVGIAADLRMVALVTSLGDLQARLSGRGFHAWMWGGALAALGVLGILFGLRGMVRSITYVVSPSAHGRLAEVLYRGRQLGAGPRVVAIGGGTGLSTLLRGLKQWSTNLAALVTVSDDGGSSGRLRREMGVLPPGDIRNCLVALADAEPLMTELFQYRFNGDRQGGGNGLEGHSFGNLLIAAMTAITGDFERAVRETSRVLAIRGRVLPSTLSDVTLIAEMSDGSKVAGESNITAHPAAVRRLRLDPPDVEPLDEAIDAILDADIVIVGPGSLYTSVIPNLLVRDIVPALQISRAMVVYVCNVMTQAGETAGYPASQHLKAILDHIGSNPFDYCLVNNAVPPPEVLAAYAAEGAEVVEADLAAIQALGVKPVVADLLSGANLARHDPVKLAAALAGMAEGAARRERARVV
jgi:uncharacterized cofD-like protein